MQDTDTISANIWTRGYKMSVEEIVGFQLLVHAYTTSLQLNDLSMKVLTIIGTKGRYELNSLVKDLAKEGLFAQEQGARNHISRLEDMGTIIKEEQKGTNKKVVYLNPTIGIQNTAPVYVDIKAVCQ